MILARGIRSSSEWWSGGLFLSPVRDQPSSNYIPSTVSKVLTRTVTAGIILFFHFRKRKESRSSKREQSLLPLHVPPPYSKTTSLDYSNHVSLDIEGQPEPYTQDPPREPDQPPAYQASLPAYDPSKYQDAHRPLSTSTMEISHQQPSMLNPVHYADARGSIQPLDNRLTIQGLSVGTHEFLGRQSGAFRGAEWPLPAQSNASPPTRQNQLEEPEPTPTTTTEDTRPRRPKPVLSRLITDF